MITSNPYTGARIPGTVGFALPDVEVRIAGAARGEPGVIEVKGPNVFKGYWGMPEKTREEFREMASSSPAMSARWTGKAASRFRGAPRISSSRAASTSIRRRSKALDALPGVIESAVIGVPHPDFGEGVVAVVTASAPLPPEAEIIADLSTRLAKFKVPKRIFVIEELPRNAMGKVQKAELRKRYASTFTPA